MKAPFIMTLWLVAVCVAAEVPGAPSNLDFNQGADGKAPPSWSMPQSAKNAGYRAEIRHEGYPRLLACVVIVPPQPKTGAHTADLSGSIFQTFSAEAYRGRTVRLRAWLRADEMRRSSGQLWLRAEQSGQAPGLLENRGDQPVRSSEWKPSELMLPIGNDIDSITIGIAATGWSEVWVRDVSFEIVPERLETTSVGSGAVNVGFNDSVEGEEPPGWTVAPVSYRAEVTGKGCRRGPPCAALTAPGKTASSASGTMMKSFSATAWHGRTIRIQAWIRLQTAGDARARFWVNTTQTNVAQSAPKASANSEFHESSSPTWERCEIVHRMEDDARYVNFGVTLVGQGSVWIDDISLEAVKGPDLPVTGVPPEPVPLSMPDPAHDDEAHIINAAAVYALNYMQRLPDFLCTQMIYRFEDRAGAGWMPRDVLTVQLGYAGGSERHKLLSVNNRPTRISYVDAGGAIYEGEFGGLLSEIFRPGSAQFRWKSYTMLRERVAYVFSYEVSSAKTEYHLQFRPPRGQTADTLAAHHGYVYIDKESGQTVRLVQIADIPANFPLRYSSIVLDYDFSNVGGRSYLLPLRAELQIGSPGLQTRNELEFRDYRKFTADSNIVFDDK